MDKFNLLITLIQAYLNACKDFHYFCTSYSLHLLADEVMGDDLADTIDAIKENMFIAEGREPLHAKEYAEATAKATPETRATDKENLKQLLELAKRIENIANAEKPVRRAGNVLLDTIADNMAHAETLLTIELKDGVNESLNVVEEYIGSIISEAEEYLIKVEHDHKACTETPVDRKEVKRTDIDYKRVADTVLNYSAQNIPEEEESTLDKLAEKLGV